MAETSDDLVKGAIGGNTRAIGRLMSLVEGTSDDAHAAMAAVHEHTGRAHVVGLTGVPGSGKSTMVRALALGLRASGRTVGIVAIDPSSPFSGGAILGDRVRMTDLTGDDGVFIRSMATRGALGGLARASLDTVDILDAAGFDVVLIETVGVGQDEVDIVQAAHTVIVVSAPGLGDEVQAIKAGVLEIADIHAVSKCDRPDADKTVSDLTAMLSLGRAGKGDGWQTPVIPTSAEKNTGIDELLNAIDGHFTHLQQSGEMAARKRKILEMRVLKNAEDIVRQRLAKHQNGRLDGLITAVEAREKDPHTAARDLLATLHHDGDL